MQIDFEKYKENVLTEIRADYKSMLDAGCTTAWETIEGLLRLTMQAVFATVGVPFPSTTIRNSAW